MQESFIKPWVSASDPRGAEAIPLSLPMRNLKRWSLILENLKSELVYSNIFVDDKIAKVSIVGAGMIDRPGIAAKMFRTLASLDINIKMISTSEIKISCLVEQNRAQDAVEALHKIFGLDTNEIAEVKGDLPNI